MRKCVWAIQYIVPQASRGSICVQVCVCVIFIYSRQRCDVWDTCAVSPADFTSGVMLKGRGLGKERRSVIRHMQIFNFETPVSLRDVNNVLDMTTAFVQLVFTSTDVSVYTRNRALVGVVSPDWRVCDNKMHIFKVYMRTTGTSDDLIIDLHNKPGFTRALRKGLFTERGAQLLQKPIFVLIIQQSANGGIRGHLGLIFKFPDLSQIRTFGRVQAGLSSRFGPSCSVTQQRLASRKNEWR